MGHPSTNPTRDLTWYKFRYRPDPLNNRAELSQPSPSPMETPTNPPYTIPNPVEIRVPFLDPTLIVMDYPRHPPIPRAGDSSTHSTHYLTQSMTIRVGPGTVIGFTSGRVAGGVHWWEYLLCWEEGWDSPGRLLRGSGTPRTNIAIS